MSDLDDFFAKRLDEEASFPNRGKNWKQMSKRLEAFDAGAVQGIRSGLRLWQAATLIAVAAAGFLLWKTLGTQRENNALRQDVATLQNEHSTLKDQLAVVEKRGIEPALVEQSASVQKNIAQTTVPSVQNLENQQKLANPPQPLAKEEKTSSPAHLAENQSENLPENDLEQPEIARAGTNVATKTSSRLPEIKVLQKNENPALADTSLAKTSEIASIPNATDTLKNASPKIDSSLAVIEKPKDTVATTPAIAQEIKPVRDTKSRFRVGAQATLGFVQPKQDGISTIRGQGITFEAKIFKAFWLTAAVDWLHHDVRTADFQPKFHPRHDSLPKPPGGGGGGGGGHHEPRLVLVESNPRQQQFGLGIRYELPLEFWARPSIRVAHEWVRMSPTLVTYKFEDDDPGGPGGPGGPPSHHEYTAEKFDAQWLSNQWRFGLGLEKDIPNWTFGLWADYSKDFSAATPSFDALYLRAGAQYRF